MVYLSAVHGYKNNIRLHDSHTDGLVARLTAQLASYPTLYYVVVTAVRRTKHLNAKLLRVSNNNELLAR